MPSGYSFRPRLWALALAAAACAAGIALGNWQARRAQEKRAAAVELEAKHVALRGTFRPEFTVLLDNKLHNHRPGYEVVTPLRLNGEHVLVNRGWIEAGRTREALPAVRTPAGEVRIEGVALEGFPRLLALDKDKPETGTVRQTLDLDAFAVQTGLRLQRRVIEQHSPLDDGLVRDWPRPDAGAEKNAAYSLQWYSLAGLAVVLAIVLSFRKDAQ